jgi:Cu+-exporting ATPase
MVTLMEGALAAKNPMEKLADRLIVFFVPAVLVIALGTAAVLLAFGATLDSALVRAVTVLVIACPCALGIATPLAKVAAVSRGRRSGLLIADPNALENAARLSTLVLDKTGTATTGEYAVRAIDTHDADADEVIALAAAVEHGSTHPLARALRDEAARRGLSRSATRLEFRPGLGAIGDVDGHRVVAGNAVLLQQEKIAIADEWREPAAGETAVYVAWDGVVHGIVRLGDEPRPDMAEAIRALRQMGIAVHLVSGDTPMTTAHIAGQLGIERFRGGVLPDEKVRLVHELRRDGVVGMVGDGANDAAALAAADVGFATDDALTVTKHASDMMLLSFSGGRLLAALQLARRTHRTIRGNLVFALAYNLVALPLALSGIVHPLLAVTAMLLSSLTVVLNSARLARGRRTGEAQND